MASGTLPVKTIVCSFKASLEEVLKRTDCKEKIVSAFETIEEKLKEFIVTDEEVDRIDGENVSKIICETCNVLNIEDDDVILICNVFTQKILEHESKNGPSTTFDSVLKTLCNNRA